LYLHLIIISFFFLKKKQVPAVLVGNKIDLRGNDVANQSLEDEVIPIMNEFKVIMLTLVDKAEQRKEKRTS
jgi:GTPase SAR1 family protein